MPRVVGRGVKERAVKEGDARTRRRIISQGNLRAAGHETRQINPWQIGVGTRIIDNPAPGFAALWRSSGGTVHPAGWIYHPRNSLRERPSPHLQGGQTDQRKDQRDDPEPDDDLRFGPAAFFEMVVNRGHQEHAAASAFEVQDLDDY